MSNVSTTPVVELNKAGKLKQAKKAHPAPNLKATTKPHAAAPVVKGKRAKKAATPPPSPKGKRGRGKIVETLTPAELSAEIRELLTDLRDSTDGEEKKRIRRALRLRGHVGGLGEKTTAEIVKATEDKKAA